MKAEEQSLNSLVSSSLYEKLDYSIHDYSSHSGAYHPRNICVSDPTEQSCRWSSGSHDQSQFVTIKLNKPAVACEILFGKFHRSHVCNLKEFKVFGGLDPHDMNELLHKGLKDDNKPETFLLRYTFHDLIFPIQYIKIAPLATFGANFNYSIWYIEIKGIKDQDLMSKVYDAYNKYKEMETIRLCLKYFRQKNMMDVYQTLKTNTGIQLEHPIIAKLHQTLVIEGDFKKAEEIILNADARHVFNPYVQEAKYVPTWQRIYASNDDGDAPCARGGHQLSIDSEREKIYLFGGWDGKRELSDFWCYHIKENRWKLLSSDTTMQGGPSARSCHAMCFDSTRKSIYVLGRYVECRPSSTMTELGLYESEFYQYFIELDRWIKISENTQMDGGPSLVCDHQMCVDPIGRKLYVFGGRIITSENVPISYSGLYSYDMDQSVWSTLRYDINHVLPPLPQPFTYLTVSEGRRRSSNGSHVPPNTSHTTKARSGHVMLIDAPNQKIYIFAGQRAKETLTDLYCYDIEQDTLVEIAQDFSTQCGSESYTQRGAIDIERQEIYISSGFTKTKVVRHCFWVYRISQNTWEKVYASDSHDAVYWHHRKDVEPCPRYTHQLVYLPRSYSHFIFGGHPGNECKRLDDFWELTLQKPDSTQIVRQCLYLLRTRKLHELCKQEYAANDTLKALSYLRNHVTPLVNYDSKDQVNHFKQLCTQLCLSQENHSNIPMQDVYFSDRTKVFQSLLDFFPANMKEPDGSLIDAVKIL